MKGIAMRSLAILLALTVALTAHAAFAQRGASSKARGEYNFYGRSAGSAIRSARDHSGFYQEYVRAAPQQQVNPEVAKEAADSVGVYITKAQKHMAYMRKVASAEKDTATLASLDTIDKHLADAAKSYEVMKDSCLKESIDSKHTLECCKPMYDHLAKASEEHDKLMKKLAAEK